MLHEKEWVVLLCYDACIKECTAFEAARQQAYLLFYEKADASDDPEVEVFFFNQQLTANKILARKIFKSSKLLHHPFTSQNHVLTCELQQFVKQEKEAMDYRTCQYVTQKRAS